MVSYSNSITDIGYALDARQANPNIEGSVCNLLYKEITNRRALFNGTELNINSESEDDGWTWIVGKWYNCSTARLIDYIAYFAIVQWRHSYITYPTYIDSTYNRVLFYSMMPSTELSIFGGIFDIEINRNTNHWRIARYMWYSLKNQAVVEIGQAADGDTVSGFKLYGIRQNL